MTEILQDEREQLNKLKDPKLLLNIVKEIQKEGVIGEEETIFVLINKIMLRIVNADPTSSNIIISDETGGGKDYIVKKTCKVVVPEKKYCHRTDISLKAFDYWKPVLKTEKDQYGKNQVEYDSWDGYVIHLEDPGEEVVNGQTFKVMSSGGTCSTKVIDHKAVDIKIDGKPVIIVTSLKTLIDNEGLRRWDSKRIDTTLEQTKAINKLKLIRACGKFEYNPDETLRKALHVNLHKKRVIIPYSLELINLLPDSLITRTQTDKLLDYIKSSAVLHQHQREQTEDGTLIADGFDLAYGWYVFIVLNGSQGIPTNLDESELLKVLIDADSSLSINKFSNLFSRHSKQWFYNNREKLVSKGLIRIQTEYNEEANKEIEMISLGTNSFMVLKGFNEVLTDIDKRGFNGFNGFKDICVYINNKRKENNLKNIFIHVFRENHENRENLSRSGLLKPLENYVKTTCQHVALDEQIKKLKAYCKDIELSSLINTYENLCYNFDTPFIEECKKRKILIFKPKGGYVFNE